jgi:hypothetical protein
MEAKAKKIAREAVSSLEESVAGHDSFTPTWTGSGETQSGRFGENRPGGGIASIFGKKSPSAGVQMGGSATSSSNLLASIRERSNEVKSLGNPNNQNKSTKQYTELLKRIRDFVRRKMPTTDALLDEFSSIPRYDAAVFRRLLKSVAVVEDGRWRLKGR